MADNKTPYAKDFENNAKLKLQLLLDKLPLDCVKYFKDIQLSTQVRTRLSYASDLLSFYKYLSHPTRFNKPVKDFTSDDINSLTRDDITNYLNYMSEHPRTGDPADACFKDSCNTSLARYLSSIKGYFKYLYAGGVIDRNVTELVKKPKSKTKDIVYLEPNEIVVLLDCIENCAKTMAEGSQQRRYQEKTYERDLAMVSLFLGTGMRISELVGIDLEHLDFDEQTVYVYRKGGKSAHLYFNDEISEALANYIFGSRISLVAKATVENENALFLSMQGTRMTVRAIEKMVDKYRKMAGIKKNLTPHKLRSTFGTELYQETGDILLVSSVLGHASTDTAKKHYASVKKENFRYASTKIALRNQ